MIVEELIAKAEAAKKCYDLLEIIRQIVIHAPDKESALQALDVIAEALKTE